MLDSEKTMTCGDVVEVAQHREGVYGVRLAVVERLTKLGAWVQAPGYEEPWLVRNEMLTVVRSA